MSAHRSYAIYKISHKDGAIVWQLGGHKSNFDWISFKDKPFDGQHDARCYMQNATHMLISIMDNANGPGQPKTTNSLSRGLLLSLQTNTQPMTVQVVGYYDHPQRSYAPARGKLQVLPNGNAFLGWSIGVLQSEYTPDGKLIMEAKLLLDWNSYGLKTYRIFKFQWSGHPKLAPDLHSPLVTNGDKFTTLVHASWNGPTEVASWKLFESYNNSRFELVATAPRQGFETPLTYHGFARYVFVQAIAHNGSALGNSETVETVTGSLSNLHPAVFRAVPWLNNYPGTTCNSNVTLGTISCEVKSTSIFRRPIVAFAGGVLTSLLITLLIRATTQFWWGRPCCVWRKASYTALSQAEDNEGGN